MVANPRDSMAVVYGKRVYADQRKFSLDPLLHLR